MSVKYWLRNFNLRVSFANLQGPNLSASSSVNTFYKNRPLTRPILRLWGDGANFSGDSKIFADLTLMLEADLFSFFIFKGCDLTTFLDDIH